MTVDGIQVFVQFLSHTEVQRKRKEEREREREGREREREREKEEREREARERERRKRERDVSEKLSIWLKELHKSLAPTTNEIRPSEFTFAGLCISFIFQSCPMIHNRNVRTKDVCQKLRTLHGPLHSAAGWGPSHSLSRESRPPWEEEDGRWVGGRREGEVAMTAGVASEVWTPECSRYHRTVHPARPLCREWMKSVLLSVYSNTN